MRILNCYAGIGGNRHLWPAEWSVTAVEIDKRIAAEYGRRYPADVVLVEDAHAYLLEHAAEFDGVWTSPPCPTHSRLARTVASKQGREIPPDPRLFDEVRHLRALGVPYVVENVHTHYRPPILPDVVTARHYYWTSTPPVMLTPADHAGIVRPDTRAAEYAAAYGLPPLTRGSVDDMRQVMRNAVIPLEGLELATAAFGLAGSGSPSAGNIAGINGNGTLRPEDAVQIDC